MFYFVVYVSTPHTEEFKQIQLLSMSPFLTLAFSQP